MGSIPTRSRHPGGRAAGRGRLPAAAPNARPDLRLPAALAVLAALALAAGPATGQEPDTAAAAPDTAAPAEAPPAAEPDTAAGPPVSPLGAFARSFVLPGWGQAEVDRPVRGAFYFLAEAASLWMVLKSQAKLSSAERGAPPRAPGDEPTPLEESRTSQRENWIVLSVFVALMSGVDAWVSAHLYDFEGELEPPEDGTAGVQLRYSVPVGAP